MCLLSIATRHLALCLITASLKAHYPIITNKLFFRDGPSADNSYSVSCSSHHRYIRSHYVLETPKSQTWFYEVSLVISTVHTAYNIVFMCSYCQVVTYLTCESWQTVKTTEKALLIVLFSDIFLDTFSVPYASRVLISKLHNKNHNILNTKISISLDCSRENSLHFIPCYF